MSDKVSVIIPTYNRFKYVMNTIKSVKNQTYKNIEIIVVNDGSTEKEYYTYDWTGINIIHLKENTKNKFGYPCVGYVINQGIKAMTGDYFATCDDDDIWFPKKLELQLRAIKNTGCKMCCTDGYAGKGVYDEKKSYKKILSQIHQDYLRKIYQNNFLNFQKNQFKLPYIWTYGFLKKYNCVIACSVLIHKSVIDKIGKQLEIKMGGTIINNKVVHIDYDYWLRALKHTNCVYVRNACVYYDVGHGDGINY
tara:strand:- start:291 stop:1040 length:750 start_codon:yes stop_codon:yes gene_type:complete